tara:strand:+ start:175619 stop:177724 length:2106 start_codon:yes stop_codon:yes gene_type:complete
MIDHLPTGSDAMKISLTIALLVFTVPLFGQQSLQLQSPDKDLTLTVELDAEGTLSYALDFKGRSVVQPSALGFEFNRPEAAVSTFQLLDSEVTTSNTTWKPVWGEVAEIQDHHNELFLELTDTGGSDIRIDLRFRVFDDGIGFRFEFPEQESMHHFIIGNEFTEFNMAGDHKTFWIPGDYDTNEYLYETTPISGINSMEVAQAESDIAVQAIIEGNAVQTPLMMKSNDGLYINIHEAALVNYPVMHLDVDSRSFKFTSNLTPDPVGNKAYLETPSVTPWRTILVSDDARDILSSKMILNLNEPSKIDDTEWIEPQKFIGVWWEMHVGKGTWDFASGNHAANTENVKKYIDFASEHGFDGVLVEGWNEGWEDWFGNWKEDVFDFVTPYPDYDIEALTDYAEEKGVRIIMHHETSGSVTNYERRMDEAFQFMKDHNMNAVKTGYVGRIIPRGEHHDGQWMTRHFIRTAEKAAEYQIMVNSHESSRPTGVHRTWPNWFASEAARGNEFNNAPKYGMTPEHQTILPFTRLIGGPMDFTPGLFRFTLNDYVRERSTVVRTTMAKQLALYITMYSPLQMAGDLPENYAPYMEAFEFIERVPLDWDDTKILLAEPGEYIVIARKEKGTENWFVGGITDEIARDATIDFNFLTPGKTYNARLYLDGSNADWKTNPYSMIMQSTKITSETELPVRLAAGGGFAISIELED